MSRAVRLAARVSLVSGVALLLMTPVPPAAYASTTAAISATVDVSSTGFVPDHSAIPMGGTVEWAFTNTSAQQSVTGVPNLGLSFDSGLQSPPAQYWFTFNAAGSFKYKDVTTGNVGFVNLPMQVSPSGGDQTTNFTLTWASAPPPAGDVSTVQVAYCSTSSCTKTWSNLVVATTATSGTFTPNQGYGYYYFHSRLINTLNNAASGWSPQVSIAVTQPPPTLPVASSWPMDEATGTTMYDSSGANNGTIFSNVTIGQPGWTSNAGDDSYGFMPVGSPSSGTLYGVQVPDPSGSLNPGSNDISMTVHVNFTAMPGTGSYDFDVLRKGTSDSGQTYKIEIFPYGGKAEAQCVFIGSSAKVTLHAGPSLNDGQWHTITCEKLASQVTLTVDGITYVSNTTIGSIDANGTLYLGYKPDNTDFYNGLLDDVSVNIGMPA